MAFKIATLNLRGLQQLGQREEVEKWMGHAFYAGHSKGHLEGYLLGLDESGDGE